MQIVEAGQPLLQPNICFLCESWPNPESGAPVVDVMRDFEAAVITPLTGRKYVCSGCAEDIARTIGFVPASERDSLLEELAERTERLARVEAMSAALNQAQDLQRVLAAILPDIDSLAQDAAENEGMAAAPYEVKPSKQGGISGKPRAKTNA